MTDLQAYRGQLFSNADGGLNVLASADHGRSWRVLLDCVDQDACTHAAFRMVGQRLLIGGECPRGTGFLRACPLAGDGVSLASSDPRPTLLPALEKRNVQFIGQAGARVFAGLKGSLLRSTDGG